MSDTVSRPRDATQLLMHRRRQSDEMHARAIERIASMLASGTRITRAGVAKSINASPWIFYNVPHVREAVEAAMNTQRVEGIVPRPRQAPGVAVSVASLRVDLELAQAEVRRLTDERRTLRSRLRTRLGDEIDQTPASDLLARVRELEDVNRGLVRDLGQARDDNASLRLAHEDSQARLAASEDAFNKLRRRYREVSASAPSGNSNVVELLPHS